MAATPGVLHYNCGQGMAHTSWFSGAQNELDCETGHTNLKITRAVCPPKSGKQVYTSTCATQEICRISRGGHSNYSAPDSKPAANEPAAASQSTCTSCLPLQNVKQCTVVKVVKEETNASAHMSHTRKLEMEPGSFASVEFPSKKRRTQALRCKTETQNSTQCKKEDPGDGSLANFKDDSRMPDSCRGGTNGAENTRPRSTRVRSLGHRLNRQSATNLADLSNVTDTLVKHAARNPFVPWKVWKRGRGTYLPCHADIKPASSDSAVSLRSIKASRTPVRRLRRLAREKGGSGSASKPSVAATISPGASPFFYAATTCTTSPALHGQDLPPSKDGGSGSSQEKVCRADDRLTTSGAHQVNGPRPRPPVPPWLSLRCRSSTCASVCNNDFPRYCYPLSRPESEDPPPLPQLTECFDGFENVAEGTGLPERNSLSSDVARRARFCIKLRCLKQIDDWSEDDGVSVSSAEPSDASEDQHETYIESSTSQGSSPPGEGVREVGLSEKPTFLPSTASTVSSVKKDRGEGRGHLRTSYSPSVDSSVDEGTGSGLL
ncbi:UNVERIFIED_CONTAM: hypothetical protein HHA_214540 [Hammondia hammondi]|eukprot:XP_008886734.1 hypothetical protein HHA_214540 [Hammondia hammondi]